MENKALQVVVTVAILFLASAAAVFAQPPEPAENRLFEQVYLAKDNGAGQAGDPATLFLPTDIPIHCVVVLSNASQVTVKMDLIAVNVPGVKAETKVISTSYMTRDLQDRVFFTGKPRGTWVAGTYRADIYIEGNLVEKLEFRILPAAIPAPSLNLQPKLPNKIKNTTAKKN
jgi:hypothetical protein